MIEKSVRDSFEKLMDLGGLGQARFIATDPLGLKNLVLKRLAFLAPGQDMDIYRGKLFTRDRRHLLVVANPDFRRNGYRFCQADYRSHRKDRSGTEKQDLRKILFL